MAHNKKHGGPIPQDNQSKAGPASKADMSRQARGGVESEAPFQDQDPKRRLGNFEGAGEHAYQQPGASDQLSTGLPVFDSRSCSNGNPAPPTSSIPDGLVPLIQQYVFRSTDRNVPAPACKQQSPFAGGTQFPQLRASP